MILQDFVCTITTDFETTSGEIMPDKSCMTFCDGLMQDLTRFIRKNVQDHGRKTMHDLSNKCVEFTMNKINRASGLIYRQFQNLQ